MPITLAQLESFCSIARLGSFRAASRHCNRTQATVSVRIHELERSLGLTLFHRAGQRARITSEGVEMLRFAEQILALSEEMEQKAQRHQGMQVTVRLGVIDSFAASCLSDLLSRLDRECPWLQIDIMIDHSITIAQKLEARQLDVAFLLEPEVGSHVIVEPLCEVPVSWVAAPSLSLPKKIIEPFDLTGTLIFSLPSPATTYTDIHRWFAESGIKPSRVSTCSSLVMIIPLIASGRGVSLLPRALTLRQLKDGSLRELPTSPAVPPRRIYVAYQPARLKSSLAAVIDGGRELILQRLRM